LLTILWYYRAAKGTESDVTDKSERLEKELRESGKEEIKILL
jgi:hypothetical protein